MMPGTNYDDVFLVTSPPHEVPGDMWEWYAPALTFVAMLIDCLVMSLHSIIKHMAQLHCTCFLLWHTGRKLAQ
eukprot:12714474-Prorocentrum_lima.AAC.1